MNNKETLNNYNSRLAKNNLDLASVLETINNLPEAGGEGSSTYVQLKEPKATQGIWLQADAKDHDNFYMKYESNIYPTLVKTQNYPKPAYGHGGAAVGRYIYTFGGLDQNYTRVNNAYKYDTVTSTFTSIANAPFYLHVPFVASAGTNVFIFGGAGGTSLSANVRTNTTYKYDTLTNTYTEMANMPYNAYNIKGVTVGTDIYLFGGGADVVLANACKYNTVDNTYSNIASLPIAMAGANITSDGKYIYIFGKITDSNYGYVKYDIENDTYSEPVETYMGAFGNGGIYMSGNYIYFAGGYDGVNGGSSNKLYKYNISDNTYEAVATFDTVLANFAYGVVDNTLHILGHQGNNGGTTYVYRKTLFPYDKPTIISTSTMWLYEDGENITENVPTYINNNDKWELV